MDKLEVKEIRKALWKRRALATIGMMATGIILMGNGVAFATDDSVYGTGKSGTGEVKSAGNIITKDDTKVYVDSSDTSAAVGDNWAGDWNGSHFTIQGGTWNYVYGGFSNNGNNVSGAKVEITGGTVSGFIYGGNSVSGEASGNTVEITGGTVNSFIYGGNSTSGKASKNKVIISKKSGGNC